MFDCTVYIFYERESFCIPILFVRNLYSGHFYLFVCLLHFRCVALEFCFTKTCKLEKEEVVFLLRPNIRYIGCPKRPGQRPVFWV
jgi:hypothetical protein